MRLAYHFQGQGHRRVSTSGSCSGGRGNVLAVGNCCYVAVCSAAQGASAPTGEERGGVISWQPPAYSMFQSNCPKCNNSIRTHVLEEGGTVLKALPCKTPSSYSNVYLKVTLRQFELLVTTVYTVITALRTRMRWVNTGLGVVLKFIPCPELFADVPRFLVTLWFISAF